jgi:hypothetical protein
MSLCCLLVCTVLKTCVGWMPECCLHAHTVLALCVSADVLKGTELSIADLATAHPLLVAKLLADVVQQQHQPQQHLARK